MKCIGPKAFVCRTCWRRDKNTYVWVVTNKHGFYEPFEPNVPETDVYCVNPHKMGNCTIVQSIRGRYVDETAPYVANIVKFIEHNFPAVRFEEFIGDFVKDESENWWLINVRGFVLSENTPLPIEVKHFLVVNEDESVDGGPRKVDSNNFRPYRVLISHSCSERQKT